jgi:POT family proton-dependent oligopeptide transporter
MDATATDRAFFGHPKGLGLLFIVEMWERFSYYGMRALLVLFLVNELGWTDARATSLYGTYTGLVYLTPLIGGWLADTFLGTRRSLVIGGVTIALGHFVLALQSMASFYLGLALVIIGTGFFKGNVTAMVGQLYRPGDVRRDAGFTIYYMGINTGAFVAPLVCGYLGQRVGWHYGFGAAGVGMLLGLVCYLVLRERMMPGIGLPPDRAARAAAAAGGAGADGGPLLAGENGKRLAALGLVFVFSTFFWLAFEQAGSSLNLFADRHTDRRIGGFELPSTWFQSINALCLITLAPVAAWTWTALRARGREPSTPVKVVLGLVGVGAGFLVMMAGGAAADAGMKAAPTILFFTYLLHTIGELCISPIGLSYFTKVAPARVTALAAGAYFLSIAAANKLGGMLAGLGQEMDSLRAFFSIPVVTSFGAAVVAALCIPLLKRLTANVPGA